MTKKNSAMRAGLGYTVGNILIKGINFLTIPFFSRLLTTEEFGICNVFLSYDAILSLFISLAIHTSIKSAHYEFKQTDEYISSVSLIFILNALICTSIIAITGSWLVGITRFKQSALFLLIPYSFGCAVVQLYNQQISLNYEYKKYLTISLLNSVGNILFSFILILTVFRTKRDIGRIIGMVASIFTIAIVLLQKMYTKTTPKYNKKFWKFALTYSLPIVPHGISQVLLGQCDRIMISNMVGNSETGIYSLAANLKLVLMVISTSISISWSTWFFAKLENHESDDIKKNANLLVGVFLIFTVTLMTFTPEIIYVLGGKEYNLAKFIAIPMIIDAYILFLYNIIVPSEYYTKKTKYIMLGTLIAATINLITNYIFIKAFGFIAAAYTTLFSYVCYLVLHIVISKKLIHFDVIEKKWITTSAAVVGLTGAIDLIFVDDMWTRYGAYVTIVGILFPTLIKYFRNTLYKKRTIKNGQD